jgi:hypothetical protein
MEVETPEVDELMAITNYIAKVKGRRLLELPEEARTLGLQPGEEVRVSVDCNGTQADGARLPNEKGLAAMREIAERQKSRPFSDGADSLKLLREARSGAMYGYEPSDE